MWDSRLTSVSVGNRSLWICDLQVMLFMQIEDFWRGGSIQLFQLSLLHQVQQVFEVLVFFSTSTSGRLGSLMLRWFCIMTSNPFFNTSRIEVTRGSGSEAMDLIYCPTQHKHQPHSDLCLPRRGMTFLSYTHTTWLQKAWGELHWGFENSELCSLKWLEKFLEVLWGI